MSLWMFSVDGKLWSHRHKAAGKYINHNTPNFQYLPRQRVFRQTKADVSAITAALASAMTAAAYAASLCTTASRRMVVRSEPKTSLPDACPGNRLSTRAGGS